MNYHKSGDESNCLNDIEMLDDKHKFLYEASTESLSNSFIMAYALPEAKINPLFAGSKSIIKAARSTSKVSFLLIQSNEDDLFYNQIIIDVDTIIIPASATYFSAIKSSSSFKKNAFLMGACELIFNKLGIFDFFLKEKKFIQGDIKPSIADIILFLSLKPLNSPFPDKNIFKSNNAPYFSNIFRWIDMMNRLSAPKLIERRLLAALDPRNDFHFHNYALDNNDKEMIKYKSNHSLMEAKNAELLVDKQLENNDKNNLLNEKESSKKPTPNINDYIKLNVLGKGSMGTVLLVREKKTSTLLAIKKISKTAVICKNELSHTFAERNILSLVSQISHPFLIRCHTAFTSDTNLFLVLDFIAGGDMATQLAKSRKFSAERVLFYAAEIVLGLIELHRLGIVYRDLKPENILLRPDGHIVLTDFGLSKDLRWVPYTSEETDNLYDTNKIIGEVKEVLPDIETENSKKSHSSNRFQLREKSSELSTISLVYDSKRKNNNLCHAKSKTSLSSPLSLDKSSPKNNLHRMRGISTSTDDNLEKTDTSMGRTRTFAGTAEYLAPEILLKKEYGFEVDWWSFGTLLHEMMCGYTPFGSENQSIMYHSIIYAPLNLPGELAPAARSVLKKLLERNPEIRLGSGKDGARQIANHEYFKLINWDDFLAHRTIPPYVPTIASEVDLSNFESTFTNISADISPIHSGLLSKSQQDCFEGFSWNPASSTLSNSFEDSFPYTSSTFNEKMQSENEQKDLGHEDSTHSYKNSNLNQVQYNITSGIQKASFSPRKHIINKNDDYFSNNSLNSNYCDHEELNNENQSLIRNMEEFGLGKNYIGSNIATSNGYKLNRLPLSGSQTSSSKHEEINKRISNTSHNNSIKSNICKNSELISNNFAVGRASKFYTAPNNDENSNINRIGEICCEERKGNRDSWKEKLMVEGINRCINQSNQLKNVNRCINNLPPSSLCSSECLNDMKRKTITIKSLLPTLSEDYAHQNSVEPSEFQNINSVNTSYNYNKTDYNSMQQNQNYSSDNNNNNNQLFKNNKWDQQKSDSKSNLLQQNLQNQHNRPYFHNYASIKTEINTLNYNHNNKNNNFYGFKSNFNNKNMYNNENKNNNNSEKFNYHNDQCNNKSNYAYNCNIGVKDSGNSSMDQTPPTRQNSSYKNNNLNNNKKITSNNGKFTNQKKEKPDFYPKLLQQSSSSALPSPLPPSSSSSSELMKAEGRKVVNKKPNYGKLKKKDIDDGNLDKGKKERDGK